MSVTARPCWASLAEAPSTDRGDMAMVGTAAASNQVQVGQKRQELRVTICEPDYIAYMSGDASKGQSALFLIPTLPDLATGCEPSKVGMRVDRINKMPRFPSYVSRVRFPSPAPNPFRFLSSPSCRDDVMLGLRPRSARGAVDSGGRLRRVRLPAMQARNFGVLAIYNKFCV
jgi:hypothetical protein